MAARPDVAVVERPDPRGEVRQRLVAERPAERQRATASAESTTIASASPRSRRCACSSSASIQAQSPVRRASSATLPRMLISMRPLAEAPRRARSPPSGRRLASRGSSSAVIAATVIELRIASSDRPACSASSPAPRASARPSHRRPWKSALMPLTSRHCAGDVQRAPSARRARGRCRPAPASARSCPGAGWRGQHSPRTRTHRGVVAQVAEPGETASNMLTPSSRSRARDQAIGTQADRRRDRARRPRRARGARSPRRPGCPPARADRRTARSASPARAGRRDPPRPSSTSTAWRRNVTACAGAPELLGAGRRGAERDPRLPAERLRLAALRWTTCTPRRSGPRARRPAPRRRSPRSGARRRGGACVGRAARASSRRPRG